MGIDYNIRLAEHLTPTEAANVVAKHFGFSYVADGLTASFLPASALSTKLTREQYDIDEVICISCRIDKFELHRRGMENLVDLFIGLLIILDSDMVVDYNGETPILFRRAGIVYVDLRERYWRERLKNA